MHQIGRATKRSVFLNKHFPKFQDRIYWAGDRKSFARAGFIGSFAMMLPIPFQMVLGSVFAYFFKANIPLATALAWVTNPLTMWPIWYGGYEFGTWMLGTPDLFTASAHITVGSQLWFDQVFPLIWKPFYIGNIVLGVLIGSFMYISIAHFHWSAISHLFKRLAPKQP
ncbi:DUF2062 domain-containing protein [Thiomicrorhabdus hydrogeniphila]